MKNCIDCPDRCAEPNCHTTCEVYAAYVAENERRKEAAYKENAVHKAVIELIENTKRKTRR